MVATLGRHFLVYTRNHGMFIKTIAMFIKSKQKLGKNLSVHHKGMDKYTQEWNTLEQLKGMS